jgi:hypothetical protein
MSKQNPTRRATTAKPAAKQPAARKPAAKKATTKAAARAKAERAPRTTCTRGHDMTDPKNHIIWKSAGNAVRCKACYDLKRGEQKARRDARKATEVTR